MSCRKFLVVSTDAVLWCDFRYGTMCNWHDVNKVVDNDNMRHSSLSHSFDVLIQYPRIQKRHLTIRATHIIKKCPRRLSISLNTRTGIYLHVTMMFPGQLYAIGTFIDISSKLYTIPHHLKVTSVSSHMFWSLIQCHSMQWVAYLLYIFFIFNIY